MGWATFFVLFVGCRAEAPPTAPRSVLLVYVDTLRADHLGAYGYARPTSPEIDRIAAGGVRFTEAFAASPWTYSSTASLVTGLLPAGHGAILPGVVRNEGKDPAVVELAPGFETLAERFAAAGFETALFARNGYLGRGNEQGFATYKNAKKSRAKNQVARALDWLDDLPGDAAFFLAVHFMDVHIPNHPSEAARAPFPELAALTEPEREQASRFRPKVGTPEDPDSARSRTRRIAMYDASIRDVDASIGELVAGLGDRRRDTLVIVTADHGEELWDHEALERSLYSDPRRLRGIGHGHTFFDEVVRVPLIVSLPGIVPPATVSAPVSLVDVLPTLVDRFGLPAGPEVDGRSFRALLEGGTIPERPLVFDSVCFGRDKQGIRDGRWKFVRSDAEPDLLIDRLADPGETTNVAAEHPAEVERLRALLDAGLSDSRRRGERVRGAAPSVHTPDAEELEELKELGYVE